MTKTELLSRILMVDVETSNTDKDLSEIIELGVLSHDSLEYSMLYKPKEPITSDVSAIHYISNSMVSNCHEFNIKEVSRYIDEKTILVGHNISFDTQMISKYGDEINNVPTICTYKLAKKIFLPFDSDLFSRFDLSFLRYALNLDADHLNPHRALDDCKVCLMLFEMLLDMFESEYNVDANDPDYLDKLNKVISTPIKLSKMPFGKHKGTPINELPKSYIIWLIDNTDRLDVNSDSYDDDLYHTIIELFS